MLPTHLALRLARRLHADRAAHAHPPPGPDPGWRTLDARLAEIHQARHRVRLAAAKNLALTLPRLTAELAAHLDDLSRQVEQLRTSCDPPAVRAPDPADTVPS